MESCAIRPAAQRRTSGPTSVLVEYNAFGFLRVYWPIVELVVLEEDLDERRPRGDCALDQRLGQRVFDIFLQGATQRTRSVTAVAGSLIEHPLLGFVSHTYGDRFLCQVLVELVDHQLQNLDQIGFGQCAEQDDFVKPVQELGVESALDFVLHQVFDLLRHHLFLLRLEPEPFPLLQVAGANVGSHDDDGVLEVHRVAETVGELAIFKDLQQDVEDIRVRLFDFVQQDDRIRCALHALSQLAALFVANVSRRRADQLRDRVLLHELGHVEANQRLLAAKHELCQRARDFRFADPSRTEEQERADRPIRAFQAGTRAADGASQGDDRLVLRDNAPVQLFLDAQQLLGLFFLDRSDRNAGPARYHVLDVLPTDNAGGGFIEVVFFAQGAQVLALFAFLVRVEARLLELVVRDGVLHTVDDELDSLLDLRDLLGQRGLAQLHAGAGFVDQVDGLVGQEAIRNVAARMGDGEVDRVVGVGDGVELLVAVLDTEQNFGGIAFVRRRDFDRLETTLQRTVFLDRLAIFAGGGGADALNLAPG